MKTLLKFIKYLNHFTNERFTPEMEAEQILKFMLLKSNTKHSIDVFTELEKQFKKEMSNRRETAYENLRLINTKFPVAPSILEMIVNDPIFEKPFKK